MTAEPPAPRLIFDINNVKYLATNPALWSNGEWATSFESVRANRTINFTLRTVKTEYFEPGYSGASRQWTDMVVYAKSLNRRYPAFGDAGGVMTLHLYPSERQRAELHGHLIMPKDELCAALERPAADVSAADGSRKRKVPGERIPARAEDDGASMRHLALSCKDVGVVPLDIIRKGDGSAMGTEVSIGKMYKGSCYHICRDDDGFAVTAGKPGEAFTWFPVKRAPCQWFRLASSEYGFLCGTTSTPPAAAGFKPILCQQWDLDHKPTELSVKTPQNGTIDKWRVVESLDEVKEPEGVWVLGVQEESPDWPPNKYFDGDVKTMETTTGASRPFGDFTHEEVDMFYHHDEPLLIFVFKANVEKSDKKIMVCVRAILKFAYDKGIAPRCHVVVGLGSNGVGNTIDGTSTCMSTVVKGQEGRANDIMCYLFVDPPVFYKGMPSDNTAADWLAAYKARGSRALLT